MTALATYSDTSSTDQWSLDDFVDGLRAVVDSGVPQIGSASDSAELIATVERARRLGAVAAVDVIAEIESTRSFYEHGHANARVMFEHVAGVSGAEAHRLDKIRRMNVRATDIAKVWRGGDLSVDKAALLARAYANPRTRQRFLLDQAWFIKQARRFDMRKFAKVVARWLEVHDQDGPEPEPDPSYERRRLSLTQDHFSKSWKLDGDLGSLQGSALNQALRAYTKAEFDRDWTAAEEIHGAETSTDLLARTDTQRRADALCQLAADAVNSDKPSAAVKRVHNIIWTADTFEELLRRWANGPTRQLDPDTYNICDIDGHPVAAGAAFADSLTSSFRRIVQDAAGVTINMGTETRLFTGLTRLGVQLTTCECYWPGCHVPTSSCEIDHLRPAARGGPTEQINGLPACKRHNRFKQRGYTINRHPDGTITITTPTGETLR